MKKIGIILSIIILGISCNDLLIEEPLSVFSESVIFSTPNGVDAAIGGIYANFYGDETDRNHWSAAVPVDGWGVNATDILQSRNQRGSFGTVSVLPNDLVNRELWDMYYRIINRANFVIQKIETELDESRETKNELIGEARFLRGFAFMELVRFYGGVPIRLDVVEDIFTQAGQQKASEEETWAQVVDDLTFAVEFMPEFSIPGRANKWVAQGMLAKAYLTMAGYPLGNYSNAVNGITNNELFRLAAENAFAVIENSGASLVAVGGAEDAFVQYGLQFTARGENSSESLWEIQYEEGIGGGGWGFRTYNGNNRTTTTNLNGQSYSWTGRFGGIFAGSEFALSFHDTDIRWKWSIAPFNVNASGRVARQVNQGAGAGWTRFKFRREENPSNQFSDPINAIILRLSDIYLVYAEAVNEFTGDPNMSLPGASMSAYDAINAIRNRAKVPELKDAYLNEASPYGDTDLMYNMSLESFNANTSEGRHVYYTGSMKERFREAVLMERAWELCFERHRWLDLKRHNKLIEYNRNAITIKGGQLADLADPIDKGNFANPNLDIGRIAPFSAGIQDHQNYMPIPQIELDTNPDIEQDDQNPGY